MVSDKNGYTYELSRNNLAAGPLWRQYIAVGGISPTGGDGTVSSATFGGGRIYVAGNRGLIGNTEYEGTVRAENPATGAYIWQHAAPFYVIGALAYDNGLVLDGGGSVLEVLDAKTGSRLYSYDTGAQVYAGPSVADGVIYTGNYAGQVLAFHLTRPVAAPAGFRAVSGNVQVVARVNPARLGPSSQVTVELRQNGAANSPYYALSVGAAATVVSYRMGFGGSTAVFDFPAPRGPEYLMIQRHGDVLDAATSPNGRSYHLLPGPEGTVVMPTRLLAGVVGGSRHAGVSGVRVGAAATEPPDQPGAHPCPAGWGCGDIGDPLLVGDQTLAGGTWTLSTAGNDIWEIADQFRFVWQKVPTNSVVSAEITNQTATSPTAKAGVMMRAGTGEGAADYAVLVTPGQGVYVERRYANGAPTDLISNPGGAVPTFVRIVRSGTTFSAETSGDGVTWTPIAGSTVTVPNLSGTLLGGLAISSNNTEKLGSATFTSVTISP